MAVKSYADRIKSNWGEKSPERQAALKDIWNGYVAECILRIEIRNQGSEVRKGGESP